MLENIAVAVVYVGFFGLMAIPAYIAVGYLERFEWFREMFPPMDRFDEEDEW